MDNSSKMNILDILNETREEDEELSDGDFFYGSETVTAKEILQTLRHEEITEITKQVLSNVDSDVSYGRIGIQILSDLTRATFHKDLIELVAKKHLLEPEDSVVIPLKTAT